MDQLTIDWSTVKMREIKGHEILSFSIKCGDIKSAYLQGSDLTREVLVKPPDEANVKGKLWKLKRGAYGMLDGGRLFYLKLEEKMI